MNRAPSLALDPYLFQISPEETGQRIDKILSDRFPNFSRSYFQYLLASGFVLLNGQPVKKGPPLPLPMKSKSILRSPPNSLFSLSPWPFKFFLKTNIF
jgi:Pseudouridylate synthases, 23S RNA-specific